MNIVRMHNLLCDKSQILLQRNGDEIDIDGEQARPSLAQYYQYLTIEQRRAHEGNQQYASFLFI